MADIGDILNELFLDHSFIFEDRGDTAMMAHRERPYLGQPQTDHGERGKTEVKGLTMRDVGDCIARGFAESLTEGDEWDFDEHAMIQNATCNVEKMMGIYPNIPPLIFDDEEQDDG